MHSIGGSCWRPVQRVTVTAAMVAALLVLGTGTMASAEDGTWENVAKLTASDGAAWQNFGHSLAIDGDTALVGVSLSAGTNEAAYVYVRSGGIWTQQAKLTAMDAAYGDGFGQSVALAGDTAVVGAHADDDSGSAYVFVRSGTTWSQQAKLTASDGAIGDVFGYSVAIDADTVVVGARYDDDNGDASGSVYVFTRSGTTWSEQEKLKASDGEAGDRFGEDVAVHGDTAVVGADSDDTWMGSAYVFLRSGTTWTQQTKLTASDGAEGDSFGRAVAIDGQTAIVGALLEDADGTDSGSAYVFLQSGTSWSQQAKLTASDGRAGRHFGSTVSVSGNLAAVGLSGGARVYVFARSGTAWTQEALLLSPNYPTGDNFGVAVAISGERLVVGAINDSTKGTGAGAAFVYEKRGLLPPTADAGPDQAIHASDTVYLDGSDSYDDRTASADLDYAWSFVSRPTGSTATLSNSTTAYPSFTADKSGEYVVQLVVTDEDDLESDPDQVVISSLNIAPTADAGPDRVVVVNTATSMSGSGTDPDGDSLTYAWTIVSKPSGSTAKLVDANTSTPDLTPDKVGEYVLSLVVSDGYDDSDPDPVVVTAVTSTDYAHKKLREANDAILALDDDDFNARGHRHAMCASIATIIRFLDSDDLEGALRHLEMLIERTDGCALRDAPDPMGASKVAAGDWITDCTAQKSVYDPLKAAWDTLTD